MSDNEKVTKNDLHDKLWEGRDFELSHLWQRSIFLATFIVALFTIYFSVLDSFTSPDTPFENSKLEIIANENLEIEGLAKTDEAMLAIMHDEDKSIVDKPSFQLIALDVICLFGFIFSVLWICMAKGSKYWYERHENGIDAAQRNSFFNDELGKECRNEFYEALWESGNYTYIPRHGALPEADHDYRIFHLNGARFSASKINIIIGYIFVIAWAILIICNDIVVDLSTFSNNIFCTIFKILIYIFLPVLTIFICILLSWLVAFYVHRDGIISLLDFLHLIFMNTDRLNINPDQSQIIWLQHLFNENIGHNNESLRIINHIRILLRHFRDHVSDTTVKIILDEFLDAEKVDARVLRLIHNNESINGIFETGLMHRAFFPDSFIATWINPQNRSEFVIITKNRIEISMIDISGVFVINRFGKFVEHQIIETGLFADTDWPRIRAGYRYDLINDARRIHIVSKDINGRTVYMTLSFPDSISDKEFYYDPESINGNGFTKLHVEYHEIPAPEVRNEIRRVIFNANIHFVGNDGLRHGSISEASSNNKRDFDLIFIKDEKGRKMEKLFDLRNVMQDLAPADGSGRTYFADKKDLKETLKTTIRKLYPKAEIRENYKTNGRFFDFLVELDNLVYPICFQCKVADIDVKYEAGETFTVDKGTNTSTAQTNARVKYWKDISVIEDYFYNDSKKGIGYVLLVTNKELYKKPVQGEDAKGKDFSLEGKKQSVLNKYKEYNGETFKYRNTSYSFEWVNIKPKKGVPYYYVITEIRQGNDPEPVENLYETVSSVDEILAKFRDEEDLSDVLFRGQKGLNYLISPKVLRSSSIEDYEKRLFTQVISQHPDDYLALTNLERLSKMQHGEIPTRLLDVSRNPLTGLFFAVSSLHSMSDDDRTEEHEIKEKTEDMADSALIKKIEERIQTSWLMYFRGAEVKEFHSEKCRCLSALPYLSDYEKLQLRYEAIMDYLIQCYSKKIVNNLFDLKPYLEKEIIEDALRFYFTGILRHGDLKLENSLDSELKKEVKRKVSVKYHSYGVNIDKIIDAINIAFSSTNSISIGGLKFIYKFIDSFPVVIPEKSQNEAQAIRQYAYTFETDKRENGCLINPETGNFESSNLCTLYGKISIECPSFSKSFRPLDLLNGIFVNPVVNTARMIAQQGAFMLYGLSAFWDVQAFINYMCSEQRKYESYSLFESILYYLIFNDDSFLISGTSSDTGFRDEDKLIGFMKQVYNAHLYKILLSDKSRIFNELKFLGVDKATMGRSEITTAYEVK